MIFGNPPFLSSSGPDHKADFGLDGKISVLVLGITPLFTRQGLYISCVDFISPEMQLLGQGSLGRGQVIIKKCRIDIPGTHIIQVICKQFTVYQLNPGIQEIIDLIPKSQPAQ